MTTTPSLSPEEIGTLGERIYHERIRSDVESGNRGKIVVIDVVSGDYEVADRDGLAARRLRARHPDAVTYGIRVGYPSAYHIQGFFQPDEP